MGFSKEFDKGAEGDYISFKDNPEVICQFISADYVDNKFKAGEKIFQFVLLVDGMEKILNSESKRLARAMQNANIDTNDWIKIVRTGEKFKTDYTVEKVDAPEAPVDNIDFNKEETE